jgi:hypothetical protein
VKPERLGPEAAESESFASPSQVPRLRVTASGRLRFVVKLWPGPGPGVTLSDS